MDKKIVKGILLLVLCMVSNMLMAQYATEFLLTDMADKVVKVEAERNISQLLTELTRAHTAKNELDLTKIRLTDDARKSILQLWQNISFRCGETEVIERCLNTLDGDYQARNIPLLIKQTDGKEQYQEAVIAFNAKGCITDFHLAISSNLYIKVLKNGQDVTDLRYRQMILDYVEQFRTAYNTKDMPFLEQIYSDDALIITGKVVRSVPSEMNNFMTQDKVVYTKQTKREYLTRLDAIFHSNKQINVIFDDLKIVKHPAKEHFYGVTLKQGYSSDHYSDVGYLFLLWDFTNTTAPKIHVRTWQPQMLNATTPLPEEEIFTCSDFDIQ